MPAVATALRWAIGSTAGYEMPFITFFPFLLAAAIWGGGLGGALALAISAAAAARLFFRPGDPLIALGAGSFVLSGGAIVLAGALLGEAVRVSRDRERRLAAAEAQLRMTVGELAHRGRNAITVLMAIVRESVRKAASLEEVEQTINARLGALARAQDEVLKASGGPMSLTALLSRTLEPFDLARFEIDCDAAPHIDPEAAAAVSLVIHELATNAVKHGALSVGGRVHVHCTAQDGTSRVEWRETGGPTVEQPQALGFGDRLLRMALAPHGGTATRRFDPEGVTCQIAVPLSQGRPNARPKAAHSLPSLQASASAKPTA